MDFIIRLAEEFFKKHKRLARYRRIFAFLAAVVVFATTYELILPAITMDRQRAFQSPGVEVGVAKDQRKGIEFAEDDSFAADSAGEDAFEAGFPEDGDFFEDDAGASGDGYAEDFSSDGTGSADDWIQSEDPGAGDTWENADEIVPGADSTGDDYSGSDADGSLTDADGTGVNASAGDDLAGVPSDSSDPENSGADISVPENAENDNTDDSTDLTDGNETDSEEAGLEGTGSASHGDGQDLETADGEDSEDASDVSSENISGDNTQDASTGASTADSKETDDTADNNSNKGDTASGSTNAGSTTAGSGEAVIEGGTAETAVEFAQDGAAAGATDLAALDATGQAAVAITYPATIIYEGKDYTVTATFDEKAKLPAEVTLSAVEILPDKVYKDENGNPLYADYEEYYQKTLEALEKENRLDDDQTVKSARFFDITFLDKEGKAVEPAAPVSIAVKYKDALSAEQTADTMAVHFEGNKADNSADANKADSEDNIEFIDDKDQGDSNENKVKAPAEITVPEILDTKTQIKMKTIQEISFEAESFSVYGVIGTEKIEAQIRTASGDTLKVTVEVNDVKDVAKLEGLRVNELDSDSDKYQNAYDAVIAAKEAEDENFDVETFGFFAADIELIDANGDAFEPDGSVKVTMELINLPADESTLVSTMEVQHLAEKDGNIDVQTVATSDDVEKKDNVITMEFSVDSFSTFTLTWTGDGESEIIPEDEAKAMLNIQENDTTYATVNVHYVDKSGNKIRSPFTSSVNGDTPVTIADLLANEIPGYTYQGAYYNSYVNEDSHGEAVTTVAASRTSSPSSGTVYDNLGNASSGRIDNNTSKPLGYSEFYSDENGNTPIYWISNTTGSQNNRFHSQKDNLSYWTRYSGPVFGARNATVTNYSFSLSFNNTEIGELTNTNTSGTWEKAADIYLVYESTDTDRKSAIIHYGTLDASLNFVEFESDKVASLDITSNTISLANTFDGYSYAGCAYQAPGSNERVTMTSNVLTKQEDDTWSIMAYSSNEDDAVEQRVTVANGSNIYVYYGNPVSHEAHPSTLDGKTPTTEKNVKDNGDGTYTITLDTSAPVVQEVDKKTANVVIVLDITSSMSWSMAEENETSSNPSTTPPLRMTTAKAAIDTLITTLNCEKTGVKLAYATFARGVDSTTEWTDGSGAAAAALNTTIQNQGYTTPGAHGTNWEAGMRAAQQELALLPSTNKFDTYVIFVTDGAPNVRYNGNNVVSATATEGYTAAQDELAAIMGTTTRTTKVYNIFCGSSTTGYNNLVNLGGTEVIRGNNEAAMQSAFSRIAHYIVENLGSSNVTIDDGVPSLSSVSAKTAGEASGFKYFKATVQNPTDDDFVKWDEAPGASYSKDNGVTWDLGAEGVLTQGTTYRLQFDVWPSQEAYDLIADLNNHLVEMTDEELEAAGVVYDEDTEKYTLTTNTHLKTTYSFDGATYSDPSTWEEKKMPLPTETIGVKKIWNNPVDWHIGDDSHLDDDENHGSVQLILLKDGEKYLYDEHSIVVAGDSPDDREWESTEPIYISCGSISKNLQTNEYVVHEDGHDYEIVEPASFAYYWDLTSAIYHPMVINGEAHYLIQDDNAEGQDGVNYFIIKNHKYVYADSGDHKLQATNDRRSNLNLQKVISDLSDDQGANRDELFEYTINMENAENADSVAASETDPHSNNYVWFSVYDPENTYREGDDAHLVGIGSLTVSNNVIAEKDGSNQETGYLYAPSGENFTVKIKEGWNLRILNIPAGSTYNIEETDMPAGFEFISAEGTVLNHTTGAEETYNPTVSGSKISGTIANSNRTYTIKATNKWESAGSELTVNKSWSSGNFVTTHGTVKVALYKNGKVIEGSVREIAAPAQSVKYDKISSLEGLEVREVVVTTEGTGEEAVTTITPIEGGGMIEVSGETTTIGNNATDTYIVTYTTGTANEGKRTDTVTNTMPQLVVNKQDMSGNQLPGAKFKITGADGKTVLTGYESITSTNAESGNLLNGIYLSNGTYYLEETDAPSGYKRLAYKVKLVVSKDSRVITAVTDPETTYLLSDQTSNNNLLYTFTVNNSTGAVLPHTGGTGKSIYTLGGIFIMMTAAMMYVFRMRRRERRLR